MCQDHVERERQKARLEQESLKAWVCLKGSKSLAEPFAEHLAEHLAGQAGR